MLPESTDHTEQRRINRWAIARDPTDLELGGQSAYVARSFAPTGSAQGPPQRPQRLRAKASRERATSS